MSFPYLAALSWRATMTEYVSTKTFNIGQLGMTEDGSRWRLCTAGAALTNPHRAKINPQEHLSGVTGDSAEAALASAIVAGDVDFTITDATNSRAVNYWKGGYCIQPRAAGDNMRYIWKSDVEVSDTYKIYVTAPFTIAYASSSTIHAYPSPWGDVRIPGASDTGGQTFEHFVCAANFDITSGYHFWGQVSGPHWFGNYTGGWPGAASDDRMLCFHQDGTVTPIDRVINTRAISQQIAGYLMFSGNYGDTLTFMMIE